MGFEFSLTHISESIDNFKKQKIYQWKSSESLNPFERFLGKCFFFVLFTLFAIFIVSSALFLIGILILLCLCIIAFAVFIVLSIITIAVTILSIIANIIIAAKATLLIMALEMKSNYTKFDLVKNFENTTKREIITVVKSESERIMWIWCIIIAYTVPELINSFLCFRKCRDNTPSVKQFLSVIVPETLYVIGVALIVFAILPQSNSNFIMFFVWCIFEWGLHNLISTFYKVEKNEVKYFFLLVDIICLSVFINYTIFNPFDGFISNMNDTGITILALILLHCGFWQDVSGSVVSLTGNITALNKARNKLKPVRNFIFGWVSIWKVIVFFISSLIILSNNGDNIEHILTEFGSSFSEHTVIFIVNNTESTKIIQSITFPILILSIQIILSTYASFKDNDIEFSRFLRGFDFRSFWGFNIPIFFLYFMKLILESISPGKNYLNTDVNSEIILSDNLFIGSTNKIELNTLSPFQSWKLTALIIPSAWIFVHFVWRIYCRLDHKLSKNDDNNSESDLIPFYNDE